MPSVVPARKFLLGFAILAVAGSAPVSAQSSKPPKQSTRISSDGASNQSSSGLSVTWDETAPKPEAPVAAPKAAPAVVDPRRPAVTKAVAYGRVVPPAPRVVSRVARSVGFIAKPAVATALAINSRYGVRYDPLTGSPRMHTGVDLDAVYGSSVGASMSGTVLYAAARGGYGNLVVVDHGSGVTTYYAHLASVAVFPGQPVDAGELIGYVGSTGRSTGPHLHYEVRANGRPFDPFTEVSVFDGGILAIGGTRIGPASGDMLAARPLPLPPSDATVISKDFEDIPVDTDVESQPD